MAVFFPVYLSPGVASAHLLSLIREIIGYKAHLKSRIISSGDPEFNKSCKDPFSKSIFTVNRGQDLDIPFRGNTIQSTTQRLSALRGVQSRM